MVEAVSGGWHFLEVLEAVVMRALRDPPVHVSDGAGLHQASVPRGMQLLRSPSKSRIPPLLDRPNRGVCDTHCPGVLVEARGSAPVHTPRGSGDRVSSRPWRAISCGVHRTAYDVCHTWRAMYLAYVFGLGRVQDRGDSFRGGGG